MSFTMVQRYTLPKASAKTSLGFICSPNPELTQPRGVRSHPVMPHTSRGRSKLESLPRDVLAVVAYHLVVDDQGIGRHPSALMPLFLTSRCIYESTSFDNNPQMYNSLFRVTFDYAALTRRYNWMVHHLADVAGRGTKIFDLFSDPRGWAIDYKTRWELSWRMRLVAKLGRVDIPDICDKEQLAADLWNIWFMMTENGQPGSVPGWLR